MRAGTCFSGSGACALEPINDNRSARRRVVNLSAYAREVNATLLEVGISDLSADGCRLTCKVALEPETAIWLKIPGVTPRRAMVRWSRGSEAGCEFDTPITEATLNEVSVGAQQTARHLRKRLNGHFG